MCFQQVKKEGEKRKIAGCVTGRCRCIVNQQHVSYKPIKWIFVGADDDDRRRGCSRAESSLVQCGSAFVVVVVVVVVTKQLLSIGL
jgi:hypothetical protein